VFVMPSAATPFDNRGENLLHARKLRGDPRRPRPDAEEQHQGGGDESPSNVEENYHAASAER
jgi:hypothetical protein